MFNILTSVRTLLEQHDELERILRKYLSGQKLNSDAKNFLLNDLSILLLTDNLTIEIATLFSPVLLDLLSRASDLTTDTITKHEWVIICLSKLVWNFPDVARFTKEYFEKSPSFFCRFEEENEPPSKKIKSEMMVAPPYKLLRAANLFLIYDMQTYKDLCDWSILTSFLNHSEPRTRWFAYQCLGRIGNIKNLNELIKDKFSNEAYLICAAEEQDNQLWNFTHFRPFGVNNDPALPVVKLQKNDFCKEVVSIEGVLMNRKSNYNVVSSMEKFVYVPSVQRSLYRLALAVSAGEPVLLQGPVGCGKTSLVEHLAAVTGRRPYEELLKVQLGDHMDSKMLLGTHVCTEVPGEFIWKSGILIQAMTEGHWLILEDIDCAPMDVISLLVPILQSRSVALPGHANRIKAAAGFQLFATQRLIRGFEGSYVEFRSNTHVIESHFRKIMLEPLTKDELKKVISTKWSRLEKISDKVLEIYSLFSADLGDQGEQSSMKEPLNLYSSHGRLVSTRDLFKFCGRLAVCIENSKKDVNITAFQNAVDCFCDSIPSSESRQSAAESFGNKLNVSTSKINFMWQQKPNIEKRENTILIGRASFEIHQDLVDVPKKEHPPVFAFTRHSCILLEKVAVATTNKEPVLLVGETGTGKTSVVQYLAHLTKHKLTVINMSQQSDSVDLIGGYKPVDLSFAVNPIKDKFMSLFCGFTGFGTERHKKCMEHITLLSTKKKYDDLFDLMIFVAGKVVEILADAKKTANAVEPLNTWKPLLDELLILQRQVKQSKNTLIFKFMEGTLVKAMKNGEWLLLDEINLAEAETLECLAGILEKNDNTLFLFEKGSKEPVERHPDFRIFACMNPATDVGKKDLPVGIRNRFTEIFVDEIEDKQDLTILVQEYLKGLSLNASSVENIVKFYLHIKKFAIESLSDGTGHYPHYSLRTLCRALNYASENPCHNVPRTLYEAFCLSFLSQLDNESHAAVMKEISEKLLGKNSTSVLKQSIPEPRGGKHKQISGYWIQKGNLEIKKDEKYIFTPTVLRNRQDLARIVSACKYPVLLQGETSVGKTSLIHWLAAATGNKCVRINNHEHTDIQEYVGTYSADAAGNLVFKEGILAEAMRNGHWIILDELNLAPTEVMEALNRVLDDNRELYIPETQTTIKAVDGFMIFATQNPPGLYGGRKLLSRAFRNRFIELHFNEIPPSELEEILFQRCQLPKQYSKKLVAVMHDLQVLRRESGVFCGKQGFITLRDLFRWGERYEKTPAPPGGLDWLQLLADEGYLLLAGRVRVEDEIKIIQETLQKHLKRKVNPDVLFNLNENTSIATKDILTKILQSSSSENFKNVVWTRNMRRLAVLVGKAMQYKEPVLLIGTTGSGKTTICQMFAEIFDKKLHSVNCHMHSESADFLGGLRPVRDPDLRECKLFEWVDGPLLDAMKEGNFFLSDEISLADDSVLERLNSVLEPEQKILVPERSFDSWNEFEIIAQEGFQFFATMNPGGDYGKKELSPALRNRFTEIWCPSSMDVSSDIIAIVEHNINKKFKLSQYASSETSGYGHAIAEFLDFFSKSEIGRRVTLSIRDVLTWVEFINLSQIQIYKESMSAAEAYLHGAFLAIIDGIGSGSLALSNENFILEIKKLCFDFLTNQVGDENIRYLQLMIPELFEEEFEQISFFYHARKARFGLGPFTVNCGPNIDGDWEQNYVLEATTTKSNVMKVLRAMQLPKPMLLEGSPGVGKTSLISILAKATGHNIVRINLSEQTDITDLFGADLPVDGGENGEFEWRDGPLIQALKKGDWILLDELNLASQSVLEGLNACLDHRNQIYIPELGKTFYIDKNISRVFCCQNPQRQGGSRKGLPQSFLNRFTKVYMKSLEGCDMEFIATSVYRNINPELISAMVQFNNEIVNEVTTKRSMGQKGAPWEFNLRDIFRWCDLMVANQSDNDYNIGEYMKLIYIDRMRTLEDREKIILKFEEVIKQCGLGPEQMVKNRCLKLNVYNNCIQLGYSFLPSKGICHGDSTMTCISSTQLPFMESLMKCIEMNWMAILVGPPGSGKSTLVHVLAELCGQELHVLSVNSEMDTIELLGGFEQADVNRRVEFIAQDLQPVFEQCIYACVLSDSSDHEKRLHDLLYKHHNVRQAICSGASFQKDWSKKLSSLSELIKALDSLKLDGTHSVISSCKKALNDLIKKSQATESHNGGQFEWVDSMLINAAIKGHWLLIDDANFCSSSVLDRLNALLEPGGVLTVNEQGIVNDELRTIVPHKDFRIILTLNPQNGEISRAMRNRGVEIFVGPGVCNIPQNKSLLTTSLFAQCKGLIHNELLIHFYFLYEKLSHCREIEPPSVSDFLSAVSLCTQMIQKHGMAYKAFEDSCIAVFAERYLNSYAKNIALNVIRDEIQQISNVKVDYSIPVTDFLPSSFDYRQSPLFSALKKQASLYTIFYRDYLGKLFDCAPFPEPDKNIRSIFVCPPPQLFSAHQTIFHLNDIKVFTFVMKVVFESCPRQCFQYMIFFLWYWVTSNFPNLKESDKEPVKVFHHYVKKYQAMMRDIDDDSLMKKLVDSAVCMFNEVGFSEVSNVEVPFDLRWNPYIYQKVMIHLRQKHEDPDSVEYELISRANRFSLLLHFKSLKFTGEIPSVQNCRNLASCAAEVARNPNAFKDSPLLPLAYLPRFVEELETSILKFMNDESMPCSDEYYWKLFDIILYYHVFQRVYTSHAEKGMESHMKLIALNASWLLKKFRNLYQGICNMPTAFSKAAIDIETNLACNTPVQKFRHKCMKLLGRPQSLPDERTADVCRLVAEIFQPVDLIDRLKSPQTKVYDFKVILTNLKNWLTVLGDATFTSLYERNSRKVASSLHTIRGQMVDVGIIHTDDDEIMCIEEKPAEQPNISNTELALDVQLLPLWDYLFITYEAEMLSKSALVTNERTQPELFKIIPSAFIRWGTEILGLNPVHLTHLIGVLQCMYQPSLTPALVYFLRHMRHGFSSDGLSALNFEIKNNKIEIKPDINKYWHYRYNWSNQYPLLTHIFSSLFEKSPGSSLMCHFPLGSYSEKVNQLKKAQAIIWKHFDRFASPKETFRRFSASIITSWFSKLLTAMASLDQEAKPPEIDIQKLDKTDILKLIEQWKIMPIIKSEGNDNILFLATENVIELQAKLDERIEDSKLQWVTGKASTLVGLLTSVLLMPRDYLDPGMKVKVKLCTYQDILVNLRIEREMRKWVNDVTCGQSLASEWVAEHPHVQGLKDLYMFYDGKTSELEKKTPFRPHEDLFYSMQNDMGYYVKNLGNPHMIIDIITKLNIVNNMTDENDLSQCDLNPLSIIQKAQKISENLENFVDRMLKKYSVYPDIIYPFLVGVEQIIFGLSMSCNSVILKEAVNNDPPQKLRYMNKMLGMYTAFSSDNCKSPLQMASTILNGSAFANLNSILSHTKDYFPNTGRLVYRMIKSAILELNNEIKFQKYHPESKLSEIKELLFSAFQYLYKSWQTQDEIKKKKMAEEAELFKTVHHEDEIPDEEKFDKELKEMFPFYEEEFGDLIKKEVDSDGSEDKAKSLSQENNRIDYDETGSMLFSDQDMFEVCQLHATAMSLLANVKSEQNDLYINRSKDLDILTPILLRHEVMSCIVKTLGHRLDSTLEKTMIREQLLLCQELQQLKGMEEDDYYDIYHDPNPSKVLTISPILQKLVNHVTALLKEFPDNPNLVQILAVTERVLSFPISDPLMKFVVGLEFVLETSQLWEQNAHSKVSIRPEMEEITQKVIEFRAMELNMWKKGLQNVIKKQYVKSAKWWFFMHPLFYTDNTYAESEKAIIKKGLQQCLEDSPIGEFPARLSILRTFLQEFNLGSSTKQSQSYANILFNIYTYYEQFLPAIEKEITQLKKPVEKELKDFVKIARWNDVNFYAVKASVEKSHRTVLKHVKAFESALLKPAKTVFTLPSKKTDDDQKPWFLDIKKEDYIYKLPKVRSEFFKERNEPFFQKFPKYQKKVKKIAKGIGENFPVAGYVNTLNDFCGNIIEALESATIEGQKAVCTRSREKKQALLKIQNKKQMLATLFKSLKSIGLSYRQGMMRYHEDRVTELMSIPAFDISKMKILKSDHSFEELLSKSSSDTNHYFYKSLAQYAQLQKLMESPSKDITLDIMHRIQGYGGHLLTLVSSQRIHLVKLMKDIDNFGCFTSMLSSVYNKQDFAYEQNLTIIPPQKYFKESNLEMSNFIEVISLTVNKFGALLNCAPQSTLSNNEHYAISSDKRSLSNAVKEDGNWSIIKLAVDNFNSEIETLLSQLSELKVSDNVISWDHLRTFSAICQSTQKAMEALMSKIAQYYNTDCLMVENLVDIYNKIVKKKTAAEEEEEKIIDSQMDEHETIEESEQSRILAKLCQKLATQVALGIQEMFVFSSSFEEEKSDNVVPDNLFTLKITESLAAAKNCLRFDKILKIIKRLKVHFRSIQNSTEALLANDNSFRLLVNLAPVLNQYYQLIKIYLAVSLGMHRTSCKFLTILLEIFSILAIKGFCIPSDLQEEAAKDGATKFEDIEDGGFGEGEGVKDVSSKLESEDQLDEAMKEGEEKKKEDESSDKDLKDEKDGVEMSEDFDGKIHSGEGNEENSDDEEEQEESEDLDKQMGEVESDEAEKLDDKVWGSDSESEGEEDLRDEDGTGGVTEHMASELVAKDNRSKEDSDGEDVSEKENKPQEASFDEPNEEYEGEKPDPMINASPSKEPEIEELPENMEITEEVGKDAEGENPEEMMESDDKQNEPENEPGEEEKGIEDTKEDGTDKMQEVAEGEKESSNVADQEEVEQPADESAETNDYILPTEKPTTEDRALPSSETKQSSADPVQTEEDMDWESGAQNSEEQHKEGLSEAKNAPSEESGHEGKKSSKKTRAVEESKQPPKLKLPSSDRSVDETAEESSAKKRPIVDKKGKSSEKSEEMDDTAEMYEHITKEEESKAQAIDIANKEQAEIRTAEKQSEDDNDFEEEIIDLSSDEEEPCNKSAGESLKTSQSHKKPGERGNKEEEMDEDIPEGNVVQTQTVIRSTESTFHTQNELWKSLNSRSQPTQRLRHMENVKMEASDKNLSANDELWRKREMSVVNLAQDLCEQLRLVLEPTKMSKFKGDYRTGKRLNMRKIIPYIASQFRKDKIWLRRTKPSKRQYQIMLAVDDSKSMGYNNVKELAFESLAVLGQSLTLLEAGELSVVSFGEKVQLLHAFQEQFSSSTGARILEQVTFSQNKTNIAQLLNYATDVMVQARQSSRHSSKETAQLLIIISDGRTIFAEGMNKVKAAVKNARDNNIFMVYLVLDNVEQNKNSILDGKYSLVKEKDLITVPYMDMFPFPFYIILREISALPQVLGEALRQWFELVTSVDR